MAILTEYESKRLIRDAGITIPAGSLVHTLKEAEETDLKIGLPAVVKSQVLGGGRYKKGAVKIASSVDDLKSALKEIMAIDPSIAERKGVLIEKKCIFEKEFYLAVISNEAEASPVFLFSAEGGIDVEKNTDKVRERRIDILEGLTDQDIDFLIGPLGHQPELAEIMRSLYTLYRNMDCSLVEINPLALTDSGYIALDARIKIDEDALFRHRELNLQLTEENLRREPTPLEIAASGIDKGDHRGTVHIVELDPDSEKKGVRIGVDCVGTGVSLAMLDELSELGYVAANFGDTSGNPPASKLYRAMRLIFLQKDIEGFVFASCVSSQQLDNTARGIIKALKEIYPETDGKPALPSVFMFRGAWDNEAMTLFKEHGISDSENVVMLGRDSTEYDAACAFDRLYKHFSNQVRIYRGLGTSNLVRKMKRRERGC